MYIFPEFLYHFFRKYLVIAEPAGPAVHLKRFDLIAATFPRITSSSLLFPYTCLVRQELKALEAVPRN